MAAPFLQHFPGHRIVEKQFSSKITIVMGGDGRGVLHHPSCSELNWQLRPGISASPITTANPACAALANDPDIIELLETAKKPAAELPITLNAKYLTHSQVADRRSLHCSWLKMGYMQ